MSFPDSPNRLEAVFVQRDITNSRYDQINISGSDLIVYLDENGKINADKVNVFASKYNLNSGSNSGSIASASWASSSISSSYALSSSYSLSSSWYRPATASVYLLFSDASFLTSWIYTKDTFLNDNINAGGFSYVIQFPSGSSFYNGLLLWSLDPLIFSGSNFKETVYFACSSSLTQSFCYFIGGEAYFLDKTGVSKRVNDTSSISFQPGITFKTASFTWNAPSSSMMWQVGAGQGSASLQTDTIYMLGVKIENW